MFSIQNRKALSISLMMLCLTVILGACGSSDGASQSPKGFGGKTVMIDSLGVIPVGLSQGGSYVVRVNNYTAENYVLDSIIASSATEMGKKSNLVEVNGKVCGTLVANGSCSIQITPKTAHSGDVILMVKMHDSKGVVKTLKQIIRLSDKISGKSGISFVNDLSRIVTSDGHYSIALPVVLNETYDDVKALNGSLVCDSNTFSKGNHCTYLLQGKALSDSTLVTTKLTGLRKGVEVSSSSANSLVKISDEPNLIISHSAHIDQANGDAKGIITVFNAGIGTATGVAVSTALPLTIADNKCTISIIGGERCEVKVSAKSETSGAGTVDIRYDVVAGQSEELSTNVSYKGHTDTNLEIQALDGASFTNVFFDQKRTGVFSLTNRGANKLTGLTVDFVNNKNKLTVSRAVVEGCDLAQPFTLAVDQACNVVVSYDAKPDQASVAAQLLVKGRFTTQGGAPGSYKTSLGIDSSAIDPEIGRVGVRYLPSRLAILNSGSQKIEESVIFYRTDSSPGDIAEVKLNKIGFSKDINGLGIVPSTPNGNIPACKMDVDLNAECLTVISYGPVDQIQAETDVGLAVDYTLDGTKLQLVTETFKVLAKMGQAVIRTDITASPVGLEDFNGKGLTTDPYKFTVFSAGRSYLDLTYTFTNIGDKAVESVELDINKPGGGSRYGVSIADDGCKDKPLAANGGECSVIVRMPDDQADAVDADAGETMGAVELPALVSYDDGSKVKQTVRPQFINYTRNWANVTFGKPEVSTILVDGGGDDDEWLIKFKATVNPTPNLSIGNEVTLQVDEGRNSGFRPGTVFAAAPCTVDTSTSNKTCDLSFKVKKRDVFAVDPDDAANRHDYYPRVSAKAEAARTLYTEVKVNLMTDYQSSVGVDNTANSGNFSIHENSKVITLNYDGLIKEGEEVEFTVVSDTTVNVRVTGSLAPFKVEGTLLGFPTLTTDSLQLSKVASLDTEELSEYEQKLQDIIESILTRNMELISQSNVATAEFVSGIETSLLDLDQDVVNDINGFVANTTFPANYVPRTKAFLRDISIFTESNSNLTETYLQRYFTQVRDAAVEYCDIVRSNPNAAASDKSGCNNASGAAWQLVYVHEAFMGVILLNRYKAKMSTTDRSQISAALNLLRSIMGGIASKPFERRDAMVAVTTLNRIYAMNIVAAKPLPVAGTTTCNFRKEHKACQITISHFQILDAVGKLPRDLVANAEELIGVDGVTNSLLDDANKRLIPRLGSKFKIHIENKDLKLSTEKEFTLVP